jgi:DNA-binding IscR family transcriptional regulator
MMMRASTRFPIAIHSLLVIAVVSGKTRISNDFFKKTGVSKATSDFIAGSVGCNAVIIRGILGNLKKAGLVTMSSGTGGTHLSVPLEAITLWDVYSAVEITGEHEIFKMHTNMSLRCPVGSHIVELLSGCFTKAVLGLKKELSSVTLAMLRDEMVQSEVSSKKQKISSPAR